MLPDLSTIRIRRHQLGMSQRELAQKAGVSQGTVAKIEGGKMVPSYIIAKNIFDVLEKLGEREEGKARDFMNELVPVAPGDPVERAQELMVEKGYSQLPVVQGGKPVGRVTEKLLLEAGGFEGPCRKVMGPPFVTVSESAPLGLLRGVLKLEDAVLVVDGEQLAGIVTKSDLLR